MKKIDYVERRVGQEIKYVLEALGSKVELSKVEFRMLGRREEGERKRGWD